MVLDQILLSKQGENVLKMLELFDGLEMITSNQVDCGTCEECLCQDIPLNEDKTLTPHYYNGVLCPRSNTTTKDIYSVEI